MSADSMTHHSKHSIRSLLSYSWAELGGYFRSARLAGNHSVAARMAQAVKLKKEIRKARKNGIDPFAETEQG